MKYFEKWKNNRNLLCSNRGFTIVGSLIAFALLGVSGAGLIHYTSNIRKTSQSTVEKLEYKPILKTKIVNGMKALLIEKNIDQNGEVAKGDNVNMYGICSLVKPPTDSYGIDEVKLNLFNMQNKNSWKQKRWQAFFSPAEWEFVSNEECKTIDSTISDNNLNQCLQYRGSMGSASETVYAIAQIIPKAFPQFKTIDISNQSESLLDSKKVVFYLRVKLLSSDNIDTGYTTYMSSLADIVWANEVGECNVMAGSEKTIVKFSGTGPGTTFNRNVFNTPIFDDEIHKRKFEILGINADVVQAGGIEDFDLFSLSGENAKVSCIKNKFKCKRRILQGQSYYDDLNFVFDVMNYTPAAIPVKAINLTFKRGNVELDGRNNGILDYGTLSLSLYHSSNETIEGNKAIEFDVPRGASSFRAVNNKTLGNKNKAPLCHNVCRTYKPSQESSYVYPFISIHENKENGTVFEKDYSDDVSNRVRCTVCHMKSCHRYGLGTFGPLREEKSVVKTQNQQGKQGIIYGLADEPLDGQIPECSVDSTYDSNSSIRKLPLEAISQSALSGPADSVCKGIAMTGLNSIDAFKDFRNSQYEAVDCNTQLPVLCFVNGHYYPAIKLTHNSNAPLELVTTTFRGAQMKCFKMGQEIGRYYDLGLFLFNTYLLEDERGGNAAQNAISAVTKLPARAGSIAGFNLQSPSDLKFRFINNASRGMFFTPPAASALSLPLKKIQDLPLPPKKIQDVIKSFMSKGYTKLWTAMEWDAGGAVVASPPWALVAKKQPFSIYFSKADGRPPVLLKDSIDNKDTLLDEDEKRFGWGPYHLKFSPSLYLALTHNIRWKGLVPWDQDKGLRFVCQNKSTEKFFITKQNNFGEADEGVGKCNSENGNFVPPESSMDWVKVMLLLNSNDDEYPYPDPKVVPDQKSGLPITHHMLNDSFLYEMKVPNSKAWVALKQVSGTDLEEAPLAKDLRLSRPWPSNSIFFEGSRSTARNAVGAGKYMTSEGVPGDLELPSLSSLLHTSIPINIGLYVQLCVQDEDGLPHSLKSLGSCSPGSSVVDLSNSGSGTFEPVGIKYMIGWDKMLTILSSKRIILHNPSGIKQRIIDINKKIDRKIEQERQRLLNNGGGG